MIFTKCSVHRITNSLIEGGYFSEGDIYDLATSGAGTAYPSGGPEFTPGVCC
jgi:hypothetical protein